MNATEKEEFASLDAAVDALAVRMKARLHEKYTEQRRIGWDNSQWALDPWDGAWTTMQDKVETLRVYLRVIRDSRKHHELGRSLACGDAVHTRASVLATDIANFAMMINSSL